MIQLFYYPRNASWAPHMILNEVGIPHELVLVDRTANEHKSEHYLTLNPTGRIPTLLDGENVIVESAAICLHLCESTPNSTLIPSVGSPQRTEFFQWLFYLTSTLQSELMVYFYPTKHTEKPEWSKQIRHVQEQRITDSFQLIDNHLAGNSYLVGDQLSVCDFFLFMLAHWASGIKQPPLAFPHLGAYLRLLANRPSVASTAIIEGTSLDSYQ